MMELKNYEDYSDWMEAIYQEKKSKNSRFSIRAFAMQLGLDSGELSGILKKKRRLPIKKAEQVAQSLGLSDENQELFILLIVANDGATKIERSLAKQKISEINLENRLKDKDVIDTKKEAIEIEGFPWFLYIVISILKTDCPLKNDPEKICEVLRITRKEYNDCLSLIYKNRIFTENKDGKLEYHPENQTKLKQSQLQFRKDYLSKLMPLVKVDARHSFFLSNFFTMNHEALPELKELILSRSLELIDRDLYKFSKNNGSNNLFHFGLTLFQIDEECDS